ncbi:type VII toxin-antitoxin system HepT family RNase toxin [Pseudomonas huanghezhanensis]|uniref:type VII toxin-antitoxin system HepT family RNase toxin n=1 Tax=Pseudomonas huanghezhanensis TaxID=3002903 RepID=UPI0022862582|nr:DUF86 domain-containing protein [Pseudomonas sp. BSw22131]
MADDVLINKAASIERGVARAKEEYQKDASTFATDLTRQDAAILNIRRACEAALDMGQHLIRREKLRVPQSARDVFELLSRGGWLETSPLATMKNRVGFRNIPVHEYQTLQLPITVAIITEHLGDFVEFSSAIIRKDAALSGS